MTRALILAGLATGLIGSAAADPREPLRGGIPEARTELRIIPTGETACPYVIEVDNRCDQRGGTNRPMRFPAGDGPLAGQTLHFDWSVSIGCGVPGDRNSITGGAQEPDRLRVTDLPEGYVALPPELESWEFDGQIDRVWVCTASSAGS